MNYTAAQKQFLAAAGVDGNLAETMRAAAEVDAEHAAMEARLNAPGALLAAALWYASQGLRVFPCRYGQKVPATRHGFKEATTDPDQIKTWWHNNPTANIGLPTGHQFDVLDIDGPEGHQSLAVMRINGLLDGPDGRPEPTLGVATTPHGTHLYYAPTGDGNTTALAPGVDYRGRGGYVLAPPSRLADGGVYRWTEPLNLGATA